MKLSSFKFLIFLRSTSLKQQLNPSSQLTTSYAMYTKNQGTNGGAIFVDEAAVLNVQECQFIANQASNGGAIYMSPTSSVEMKGI